MTCSGLRPAGGFLLRRWVRVKQSAPREFGGIIADAGSHREHERRLPAALLTQDRPVAESAMEQSAGDALERSPRPRSARVSPISRVCRARPHRRSGCEAVARPAPVRRAAAGTGCYAAGTRRPRRAGARPAAVTSCEARPRRTAGLRRSSANGGSEQPRLRMPGRRGRHRRFTALDSRFFQILGASPSSNTP